MVSSFSEDSLNFLLYHVRELEEEGFTFSVLHLSHHPENALGADDLEPGFFCTMSLDEEIIRIQRIMKPVKDFRDGDHEEPVLVLEDLEKPFIQTAFYKMIEAHVIYEENTNKLKFIGDYDTRDVEELFRQN